jgi:hypothetical protein
MRWEPVWEDMNQESANKLVGVQSDLFLPVIVAVILPTKGHSAIFNIEDAVVGDGHTGV